MQNENSIAEAQVRAEEMSQPATAEAQQPEQEVVQEVQLAPEVQAAHYLHGALPAFRRQLDKVTGTQAKRVLEALAEAPLEKNVPGFTTKDAEDLFTMGLMISNAKFILFNVALRDKEIAESVEAAAVEAGTEAGKVEETKGEESNG